MVLVSWLWGGTRGEGRGGDGIEGEREGRGGDEIEEVVRWDGMG